jgi:serine/threonine-protein kinase
MSAGGGGERTLGSYVVERELGSGGMGAVLLGRHKLLDRPAVLKRLRRELSGQDEHTERFRREARAAASVQHPNIVAVYDCFLWRNELYIAQEFVDGVDLRDALARGGRLAPRLAGLVALELLHALEVIHAQGIVHRDLKPANVLLGRDGSVKLADFGIALEGTSSSLTQPGMLVGSPPYMPPEQLSGERVDARGDLFAWGVVFYEMLAGAPPFRAPDEGEPESLLKRIQKGSFVPVRRAVPATPRAVARMVEECLRAKPKQRPASSALLREQLERRLGRPDSDARRDEIARWIESARIVDTEGSRTVLAPIVRTRPRRRRGAGRTAKVATALAAGVAAVLLGMFATDLVRFARASATAVATAFETPQAASATPPAPPPAPTAAATAPTPAPAPKKATAVKPTTKTTKSTTATKAPAKTTTAAKTSKTSTKPKTSTTSKTSKTTRR